MMISHEKWNYQFVSNYHYFTCILWFLFC